jgi:hypothetical protein
MNDTHVAKASSCRKLGTWADKKEEKSKSNTVRVSFYAMNDPYWSDIEAIKPSC